MTQGISKSCPLSPLLGALYLDELDREMEKRNIFYLRFKDDWVILAKTRWHLKKAIKKCNQILEKLKLKKHPDKTFIGYVKKQFDFLGFKYGRLGLVNLADKTRQQYIAKCLKLYEEKEALKMYKKNIQRWIVGCFAFEVVAR